MKAPILRHVAVDAEFLTVGGSILARSVAFVPFSLRKEPSPQVLA